MALIGEIRKNSWLLIILIGLGLAAFIMMDMFSGDRSLFGGQTRNAGSINGEPISWQEFQNAEGILYRNSGGDPFQRRQALWDFFVEEKLVNDEASKLGLSVPKTELMDLQFGPIPSPIIQQSFRNPQTNQLDRTQLDQFKTQIEDNTITGFARQYWAEQEKQIIKLRKQEKLANMVTKGLYTPNWMVEQIHSDQNQIASFSYVKIPFDDIQNNVEVSDADMNAYLAANAVKFTQDEETRKVDYLEFTVEATSADSAKIRETLEGNKSIFGQTADDQLTEYVTNNFGSYQDRFLTRDETPKAIIDEAFNLPVGTVVGPYIDGGNYRVAKIVDRRVLPDSASSRHILISAQSEEQFSQAQKTIDSLKLVLESGQATFDSLAIKFSQDPGSASKGGVYDNVSVNQFVPEYRDIIFYSGTIGKLYSARTSYGVHLIEPMGRTVGENKTYVKLAYLNEAIVPSDETQDEKFEEVYTLMNEATTLEDLNEIAANTPGISVVTSPAFKKNDFILGALGGSQSSRDIIKWAFGANVGETAKDVYRYQDRVNLYDNKYILAALKSVQAAGSPALANVKDEILPLVTNEKKAASIKSSLQGKALTNVASNYSTEVDTIKSIKFDALTIPGLGNEPKVVASAFNLQPNQTSSPIIGENGIYLVQLISKTPASTPTNIPSLRKNASSDIQSKISGQLMNSLKKNANIEDNRSTIY